MPSASKGSHGKVYLIFTNVNSKPQNAGEHILWEMSNKFLEFSDDFGGDIELTCDTFLVFLSSSVKSCPGLSCFMTRYENRSKYPPIIQGWRKACTRVSREMHPSDQDRFLLSDKDQFPLYFRYFLIFDELHSSLGMEHQQYPLKWIGGFPGMSSDEGCGKGLSLTVFQTEVSKRIPVMSLKDLQIIFDQHFDHTTEGRICLDDYAD